MREEKRINKRKLNCVVAFAVGHLNILEVKTFQVFREHQTLSNGFSIRFAHILRQQTSPHLCDSAIYLGIYGRPTNEGTNGKNNNI